MKFRVLFYFILGLALPIPTVAHVLLSSNVEARSESHSCAETLVAPGNVNKRNGAALSSISYSNPSTLLPKKEVMRRDPSGLAETVLTPLSLSLREDIAMRFNMSRAIGSSGLALAISSLVVGCGGGGGASDGSTQEAVTATAPSAPVVTSGADSTPTQAGATTTASSGNSDASSTSMTTTTSTSTDAPTTVAIADPDAAAGAGAVGATSGNAASKPRAGVGTNLTQVSYFSTEYPTIDFMKRAGGWLTQCSVYINKDCKTSPWDSGEEAQLDLDANGWVKSLPATGSSSVYRYVSTIINSGGAQPVGKYVVLYDGQGTLSYGGVATKVGAESTPGRDVVSVTNGTGAFLLSVLATTPSNYVRNIRVYAPGGACSGDMTTYVTSAAACTGSTGSYVAFEHFPTGSTWFPTFMNGVKGFRTLRFMDWGQTNLTQVTAWTQRTSPTARSWAGNAGVPLEAMFDLAKNAAADPWMNIPPYATDDYIHQFGKLAHSLLAPGLTLNLEYGNEMWNYGFPATVWSQAQAKVAFAANIAKGVDVTTLTVNWYAQRLTQACNIVKGEFGADASRVRCIANTQASNAWDTSQVLSCPYAGGACAKSIDAVAIAPYFGQYISNGSNRPTVTTWYTDSDSGLSKMFQELVGSDGPGNAAVLTPLASTSKVPGGALAQIKSWMVATKAAVDKYGIPMWAYEGGQGLLQASSDTDQNLLNLMIAANRDTRMGSAYQQMLQDWVAAGGQTFTLFTDVTPDSKYGFWGLRETQFATTANSPKWATAVRWRDSTACWWAGC